jgi:hypothetical protein
MQSILLFSITLLLPDLPVKYSLQHARPEDLVFMVSNKRRLTKSNAALKQRIPGIQQRNPRNSYISIGARDRTQFKTLITESIKIEKKKRRKRKKKGAL